MIIAFKGRLKDHVNHLIAVAPAEISSLYHQSHSGSLPDVSLPKIKKPNATKTSKKHKTRKLVHRDLHVPQNQSSHRSTLFSSSCLTCGVLTSQQTRGLVLQHT